jgi:preprotein translocase subunit YajC
MQFLSVFLLDLLILQPAATPSAAATSGGDAGGGGASSSKGCGLQAGMMVAIFALTYFLLLRPERKRQEEQERVLGSLRVGQKVRTSGGILGEIIAMTPRAVTLAIADKVRINVLRANIAGPEVEEKPADPKDTKSDKDAKSEKDKAEKAEKAEKADREEKKE